MRRYVAALCFICVAAASQGHAASKTEIKYFILAGTMEPLMIMEPGNPMAGGMFTEIVKRVFQDSPYVVEPMVMPWQRMTVELKKRKDWIMHGIPAFFEPDIPYRLSNIPVFPFNHIAVTLRDKPLKIRTAQDLFDRTVILVENYHYPGLDLHLDKPLIGKGGGKIKSIRAFKPQGTLRMLKHRRGDAVIGFQPRLLYHLQAADLKFDDVRFQDASAIVPTQPMYIAFSPKLPGSFEMFVNERLEALRSRGEITEILERYYGPIGVPRFAGAERKN
ncbi:MAG: substrate-binding periplasmic protein [Methyloligellaceae bacterium]